MNQHERDVEMSYYQKVVARLHVLLEELESSLEQSQRALAQWREEMWENGRHVIRDLDDALDVFSLTQTIVSENRTAVQIEKEVRDFQHMLDSPYFGRIDFYDENERELLNVYIGRRACLSENRYEFYVYDWRSPIASLFYDFDCGPAHFDTPQGECTGEIRLKRQYHIEHGEMLAMYDADTLVQDDILGGILSRQAGDKLKDIAQSIQKEQNSAIRFVGPRHMLVLGPAGSGKTSVGLHRMAFLLYHKRGQLTSEDICVVSANHAFSEYISGILPDLYEADLQRTVFANLFERYVPEGKHIGGYFEQVEYLLHADEKDARVRWIAALYSIEFLTHLRAVIDAMEIEMMDIRILGNVILSKEDAEAFVRAGHVVGYHALLQRAEHTIRQAIQDHFLLKHADFREAADETADLIEEDDLEQYVEQQRDEAIALHLRELKERNDLNAPALLMRALRTYTGPMPDDAIDAYAMRRNAGVLYYEDWIALLCAMANMGEIEPMTGIRYVLIDEAQDYSAPQHMLLRAMFPRASFTLLADPGQVVLPYIAVSDEEALSALYPGGLEAFRLHKSYRFTGAIGALAAKLIAGHFPISYYEREGKRPMLIRTDNAAREVSALLREPFEGSTAVLTITQAAAERLYCALDAGSDVELLVESGSAAMGRTMIMPLFMSKGLEFDRVLVVLSESDRMGTARRDHAYYLLSTRALHELVVLCEGEVPEEWRRCEALMDGVPSVV